MTMELREEARKREEERNLAEEKRKEFTRDIRRLASLPEGERLFRWLLEQGGIYQIDCPQGFSGAFRAGRRAFALTIWHVLRTNLDTRRFAAIALPDNGGDSQTDRLAAEPDMGEDATFLA